MITNTNTRRCLVCGRALKSCPNPIGPKCAKKVGTQKVKDLELKVAQKFDMFREVPDGPTETPGASEQTGTEAVVAGQ